MQRLWMKMLAVVIAIFAVSATPVMAQATRTWVSGVGDDVNPCSRTAPCKTFAGAISKTATRGEINCLDSGGFGAVTITKSITLRCVGVEGGVLASAGNAIIINIPGTSGRVALVGLDIEGLDDDTVSQGTNGVRVLSAADVLIEDCTIHGFGTAGVSVETTATTRVTVRHSTLNSNDKGVSLIATGGTGTVRVVDSLVNNVTAGLSVDGASNTIVLMNNRIIGPSGLQMTNGGTTKSFGSNYISSGSVPTTTSPPQ